MLYSYFIRLISLICVGIISVGAVHAQTQAEMNETALLTYKKADSKLNKVYQQLLQQLSGHEKQLLIAAEKSWIQYKTAHCGYVSASYEGGSIQPLIYYTCLIDVTNERITFLEKDIQERKNK